MLRLSVNIKLLGWSCGPWSLSPQGQSKCLRDGKAGRRGLANALSESVCHTGVQ